MNIILLIAVTFIMGFISAIPIGSVQIEVIKRALHEKTKSALVMIAGAFLADFFYGMVAFRGIMPFLKNRAVMDAFEFLSAVILAVLSYITIKNRNRYDLDNIQHYILKSKRVSLLLGLTLGLTNPVIIFWWLLCANIIGDIGLYNTFSKTTAFTAVSSGAFGLALYLILLLLIIRKARQLISHSVLSKIYTVLGILLAGLSVYFFYTAFN